MRYAMKLTTITPLAVIAALVAVGCGSSSPGSVAPATASELVKPKPSMDGSKAVGGPASMNAKNMTLGPGSANFGDKAK
jgi:ABC-type phosphate transport system substrate-binding protein